MKRRELLEFGFVFIALGGSVRAGENTDPSGDWKWIHTRLDNVVVDMSMTLKFVDEKPTGKVTLPNKDKVEIEKASFKDGELSFTITLEGPMGRNNITRKYNGKLDGDSIKGKLEETRRGKITTSDWEAKREKP